MKIMLLMTVSLLALASVPAFAAGPYVAGDLGLAIFHDSDVKAEGVPTTKEAYKTGFGIDIAGGYTLNENLRAEAELGYRTADFSEDTTVSSSVLSFMANGYYDITQFKLPVIPYAGLGLGILNGKFKSPIISDSDTALGYQLLLGATYPINKEVSVNVGYKLQGALGDFEILNTTEFSYLSSTLLIGARYNF